MPLTVPEPKMPTTAEALLLARGKSGAFVPKGKAEELLASRLMSAGLLNVKSSYERGRPVNAVFTSFLGGYALAGWAFKRAKKGRR